MKKITLGIADDNKEFCEILTDYFADFDEIEVSFVCYDGLKTVEAVSYTHLTGQAPDAAGHE